MAEPPWPSRLGKYAIERRLAYGGMAEVFLASLSGADGFTKRVVIKRVLPQHAADPRFVEMFRYEASLTARLSHGNIVQVLELGEDDGYFLVLEYVDGASLREVLGVLAANNEPLSVAEAAHVAGQVAGALDYAHRKRDEAGKRLEVVHRDVSPSNILLSHEGQVKLTDFGVARARDRAEGSRTNTVKGKAEYLAPETILQGVVNARSDLFGLGAVLWEMLAGRAAFGAESGVRAMFNVMNEEVEPPSRLNPMVPEALDDLVLSMLAKDPALRPSRGLEVARALEPFEQSKVPVVELLAETVARAPGRRPPSSREVTPSRSRTTRTAAGRRRALVLDQSATSRALLTAKLEPAYRVVSAGARDEALDWLAREPPDLVLCQRFLGGDAGLDLCRAMRATPSSAEIPFILLATDADDALRAEAHAAGAQAVVAKSIEPGALLALCEELATRAARADHA